MDLLDVRTLYVVEAVKTGTDSYQLNVYVIPNPGPSDPQPESHRTYQIVIDGKCIECKMERSLRTEKDTNITRKEVPFPCYHRRLEIKPAIGEKLLPDAGSESAVIRIFREE